MNSRKKQKGMTLKDELARLVGAQYATEEGQRYSFRRNKRLGQSGNSTQLWMCLAVKIKSNIVKNNKNKNVRSLNQGKLEVVKEEMKL